MKLGRVSQFIITSVAWAFITAFVAIKSYDNGYIHGLESATKIFLEFIKK
jgi:hypothetical protein